MAASNASGMRCAVQDTPSPFGDDEAPLVLPCKTERIAALVLAAWAGGLWTICGVVVPGLFWVMDDNKLAGNVATQFFYIETVLATIFGLMYWGLERLRLDSISRRWLWAAIAAPLVFLLVLRPVMAAARATGDMARFGQLHGLSTTLFLIACVSVGMLIWRVRRRAG